MTDEDRRTLAAQELKEGSAGLRIDFTDYDTGKTVSKSYDEARKMGFESSILSTTIPYYQDGVNFTPNEPTTSSISLDTSTGAINITAPKSVTNDDEFKKSLDLYKTYSSNYKINPNTQYTLKNSDGTQEGVTLEEYIKRLNTPVDTGQKDKSGEAIKISPFQSEVNGYLYAQSVREYIGPNYQQIDEEGNISAVPLTREDIVRMTTNGLERDQNDNTRVAVPRGIEELEKAGLYSDEDWDDDLSTTTVKKLQELWHNREKTNSQEILTVYGKLGRYLSDSKNRPTNVEDVDTEKWTAAYALYTFLSEKDPTCSMFRGAWDALNGVADGALEATSNYVELGTQALADLSEKVIDLTINLYEDGYSADPFRDRPETNFDIWAKTVDEVMDVKLFAKEWGFGLGEFDKAADVKLELDTIKENLKGVLGIGVDAETASRFAREGADPNLSSVYTGTRAVATTFIQLGVAIHVGNVLADATAAKVGEVAKNLVEGAETITQMTNAGTKGWVAIMGAKGTAQVLNLVSKTLMNPAVNGLMNVVGESIGEALFQSPEVLGEILRSDDLNKEAQIYLWDTYLGNAFALGVATVGSKALMAVGKTAKGQAISRNLQNTLWKWQGKAGDILDGIRIKLSGSSDVVEWLDKIGSKGLTEASHNRHVYKESIMAQQRTLRRARQAIAENSPKIKWAGESAESILKQIKSADDLLNKIMDYEDALDDLARGNAFRKLEMLEDYPSFDAANTNLQKTYADLIEAQTNAGLKAADKVGDAALFSKPVKEYIEAQKRIAIGQSTITAKRLSKAVNATEGIDVIEKEIAHWDGIVKNFQKEHAGLVELADRYVDANREWWGTFNTMRAEMGLISEIDIAKWREEGVWGDHGELYARQQRMQEQSDYIVRRRDGKVNRKLERDMGHYNWGSTEGFVDPTIVAQQEFEIAAEQANRIEAARAYNDITGTASVKKSAEDVRVANEVRPYLKAYNNEVHQNIKPLVGQLDAEGVFNESIKAHELQQEATSAEATARRIERTRVSRKTPTMGEMQSTVSRLDDGAVDTLWQEVYGDKTVEQVTAELAVRDKTFYRGQIRGTTEFSLNDPTKVSDTIKEGYFITTDADYATPFGSEVLKFGAQNDAIIEAEEAKLLQDTAKKQNANKAYMRNLEKTDPDMARIITEAAHGDPKATAILGDKPIIATSNPNTIMVEDGASLRPATEYVYYRDIRPDLDQSFDSQLQPATKRSLLAQNEATRTAPYMKNQVMEARQMEYDTIIRDGYSDAAERAALLSAEAEAQEELIYDMGSRVLDDFSETFFAKGSNANKVADEVMLRYGGDTPATLGEYLYYDALKKNKASLAREVKAQAKRAFENYEVKLDGKTTHPYKAKAEYLANKVSKNISDQVEVRFNASRVAVSNMGGDAAKLLDYDSWQREIYEVANEIHELKAANNTIAIPNASGETELVEVDPLLSIFINSTTQYTPMGALGRLNYLWMRLFRLGTTGLNPTSWVNQYYRDLGNAWVMGDISETLSQATEELADIFGRDAGYFLSQYSEEVQENLLKLSKEQSKELVQVMAEREIRRGKLYAEASSESAMTRLWRGTKNQWYVGGQKRGLWDKTMDFFDKFEEKATVVNETREKYLRNLVYGNNFTDAIKNGKSIEQARIFAEYIASNATTNFTRGVAFMSQFQNTIPYFRSAINGSRSFYRLWSLDPVGVTGRIIGGLVIPAFALTTMSLTTEENRKAYKKIQAYQKENALPFVMDGETYFIPLPQELSAFIAPFRQAAETICGLGYNNGLELAMNDLLALSPVDLGGFTDIDSWRVYGTGPEWTERLSRGGAQLFSQIMPKWAVSAATYATGRDLYTGSKIDTSRVTVDPDTGEQRVITYKGGVIANQLNKVFPDLPAPIAQEMLENVFGTAGSQLMDFLIDVIGQTATFNFDYISAGQALLEDVAQDITKPMRPYVEARESVDWRHAISDLWDMKNDILSPNTTQGQAWQAMLTNRHNATTQTERDAVATARSNILDPFYKEVMSAVNNLVAADPTAFTDYKLGSVLSLINFGSVNDSVNSATDQSAKDIYNQSKYAAIETMVNMGFPNVNSPNILGTIKVNNQGQSYIQWNTPLQILDMENTIYAQGAIFAADIKNRLTKNGITSAELSAARDAYYAETDKNKKKQIAVEWDTKIATAIAPYIQQYGAEAITSSNDVIDLLDGWLIIPSDYTQKYNSRVDIGRGYSKKFLKDIFGAKK